ncbi:sugar isomerase domain-containing protein [Brachybacterium sacelli]
MIEDLTALVSRVVEGNHDALDEAADAIAASGGSGGLLYAAGAGHSLAAVMETFFRAGGLAFVRPLWDHSILPLAGARASTAAEREPGLGTDVAQRAGITEADAVLIFSNSGVNPYPVEIAQHAHEVGACVIAMTSVDASASAPKRAGHRLFEISDIVLDTAVPAGDVTWPPQAPVTAPASTILTASLWAAILRRVDTLAPDAPRWTSANVAGGDEVNAALVERFGPRIPEL